MSSRYDEEYRQFQSLVEEELRYQVGVTRGFAELVAAVRFVRPNGMLWISPGTEQKHCGYSLGFCRHRMLSVLQVPNRISYLVLWTPTAEASGGSSIWFGNLHFREVSELPDRLEGTWMVVRMPESPEYPHGLQCVVTAERCQMDWLPFLPENRAAGVDPPGGVQSALADGSDQQDGQVQEGSATPDPEPEPKPERRSRRRKGS